MHPIIITTEREADGRWIGAVDTMPGVLAYGATRDEAVQRTQALALRVIADRLDHGELRDESLHVAFEAA